MRTTIQLDDDLFAEAKQVATETGRSLAALVEEALREALARRKKRPSKQHVKLPTYGRGGLQPGVDLDNSASLWELMDSENG